MKTVLKTTLARIKKIDNQKIQILSSKLGISGVELFSVLIQSYETINDIKGKELKPIILKCTKKGIKIKRSRSKNQSYPVPQERIVS